MKIKDLKPAAYNPRKITDEQLARLKKALLEFGDLSGIVFNRKTGNLVGGHQRIKCLPPDAQIEKTKLKKSSRTGTIAEGFVIIDGEKFSYREVDWPLEKEKAANIAANQHGGEFDDELLAGILKELSETPDFDIDILGFEDKEISDILSSITKDGQIEDDEVPEVNTPEPITKTGDLYILGKHRLLCGDATKKEDIEKLMDGKKADMVFTDPPYGVGYKYNSHNDNVSEDDHAKFSTWLVESALKLSNRFVITPGCNNLELYCRISEPTHIGCWTKTNAMSPGRITHFWAWEPVFFYGRFKRNRGNDVFNFPVGKQHDTCDHTCPKPIALWQDIVENFSEPKELIFDPFLGSGSTLIACEKTGRICYGMEIDPHYCDVIVMRYCKYTGSNTVTKNGKEIKWQV